MERKQASDFHPEVLRLFDQYVHGLIDRRGFLERAARFVAGGVTASMLLDSLNPRFAEAQQIAQDDRRLATRDRKSTRLNSSHVASSYAVIIPHLHPFPTRRSSDLSDFHPEVLSLFDQYVHGLIDRRGFLERAARFVAGGVTASMLLDSLNPRFAEAQQIAQDDRRLAT